MKRKWIMVRPYNIDILRKAYYENIRVFEQLPVDDRHQVARCIRYWRGYFREAAQLKILPSPPREYPTNTW